MMRLTSLTICLPSSSVILSSSSSSCLTRSRSSTVTEPSSFGYLLHPGRIIFIDGGENAFFGRDDRLDFLAGLELDVIGIAEVRGVRHRDRENAVLFEKRDRLVPARHFFGMSLMRSLLKVKFSSTTC